VVDSQGKYIFSYSAPALTEVNLSAANTVGEYAFTYCRKLSSVVLGENITEIGTYAFAGCEKLTEINMENIKVIGDYAFAESAVTSMNLPNVEKIGKYAFVNCMALTNLSLSENGCVIGEGAFINASLKTVENMQYVTEIDNFAFANTDLIEVDLSAATKIGGALVKPGIKALKDSVDPDTFGAAPVLGLRGPVFIGHGSSSPLAVKNSIGLAIRSVEQGLTEKIAGALTAADADENAKA
jgi:hypothetical protein